MERRNRSLNALSELRYLDSLDSEERAESLKKWVLQYLTESKIEDFDLCLEDLHSLSELLYRNISFLKEHKKDMKFVIDNQKKIREFLK
jgi:hypothetical protein